MIRGGLQGVSFTMFVIFNVSQILAVGLVEVIVASHSS